MQFNSPAELTPDAIEKMSGSDLIDNAILCYDETLDPIAHEQLKALFMLQAQKVRCKTELTKLFSTLKREAKALAKHNEQVDMLQDAGFLQRNSEGKVKQSIENILLVMHNDPFYDGIQYNLIANAPERQIQKENGEFEIKRWCDADEAKSRNYLEQKYGLYHKDKHSDALRILWKEREYNPIQDIVNAIEWDGTERIEHFLCKWGKAEDTPYTREVSRLIFAGAIARLYVAGIKFDDVPVFVGKQGCGKSTLARYLAINDKYFAEVKEIQGQAAIEQLDGAFICEIAELAAITKAKELEAVKAFITRQNDKYRKPFDRNVSDVPRRCIFIGTTNNPNFLTDLTGNRRFYPVTFHSDAYYIADHEQECRDYILQCYAEAREKWQKGELPNYARKDLIPLYREAQQNAEQDDWRIGAIRQYLDTKSVGAFVCVREIAHNALSVDPEHPHDPQPKESKEIGLIMSRFDEWERVTSHRFSQYGTQKAYKKIAESPKDAESAESEIYDVDDNEALPF